LDDVAMSRSLAALSVVICLVAGGCSQQAATPVLQGDVKTIDTGLRVRALLERELMLVDERLQMQALDGTLAGGDAPSQLNAAAQQLLGAPISDAAQNTILADQTTAAQTFFAYVDGAIGRSSDSGWRTFAGGRMAEIRADYADAMVKGLDPGPQLSDAYVILARSRGVQGREAATPFDNAEADADRVLPTSPNLPPSPSPQPVMPVGSS
jgi:hypothetical protein